MSIAEEMWDFALCVYEEVGGMVCPECRTEIEEPRAFCPYCGVPLKRAAPDRGLREALLPCLIALGMAAGALWWAWQAAGG